MEELKNTNEVIVDGFVEEPNEVMVMDDSDIYEDLDEESNVLSTIVKVAAGAALATGVAIAAKKREKIKAKLTELKIKSLQKKGYHVFEPDVEVEYDPGDASDDNEPDRYSETEKK